MGKADQARPLFTESESEDYETLKTKREKLSSCCKELRKLRRLVIGGHKGLAADTVEAKETLKKELKTDITNLNKRVKNAFDKAYNKIRRTQKEKGCLLRSRREPGLQQGNKEKPVTLKNKAASKEELVKPYVQKCLDHVTRIAIKRCIHITACVDHATRIAIERQRSKNDETWIMFWKEITLKRQRSKNDETWRSKGGSHH